MRNHKAVNVVILMSACVAMCWMLWAAGVAMKIPYSQQIAIGITVFVATVLFSRELLGHRIACNIEQIWFRFFVWGIFAGVLGGLGIWYLELGTLGQGVLWAGGTLGSALFAVDLFRNGIKHCAVRVTLNELKSASAWRVQDEQAATYVLKRGKQTIVLPKYDPTIKEVRTCCGETIPR